MRLALRMVFTISLILLIIFMALQVNAAYPTSPGNKYPPALFGKKGAVTGKVSLSTNTSMGIAKCYVAIVNSSNISEEYTNSTTDANGLFQLVGINATFSGRNLTGNPAVGDGSFEAGRAAYRIYANKSPYGEGYSEPFGIGSDLGDSCGLSLPVVLPGPSPSPARQKVTPTVMVTVAPTTMAVPVHTSTAAPLLSGTPTPAPTGMADDTPNATPLPPAIAILSLLVSAAIYLTGKNK